MDVLEQAICKDCKGQGPKLGLSRGGRCMGCEQARFRAHWYVRVERRFRRWLFVNFNNEPMRMEPNVWDRLYYGALACWCQIRGHKIEVETFAGPEEGWDDIHCATCGQDFSVTYY